MTGVQTCALPIYTKGIARKCFEELAGFKGLLQKQEDLKMALTHPLIPRSAKINIWEKVSKKLGVSEITSHFLKMLIDRNRLSYFEGIVAFIEDFIDQSQNLKRVDLRLAAPLGEEQETALKEKVKATLKLENVEFTTSYDESLIAGMVVSLGDRVFDGSLSGRLKSLQKQLLQ